MSKNRPPLDSKFIFQEKGGENWYFLMPKNSGAQGAGPRGGFYLQIPDDLSRTRLKALWQRYPKKSNQSDPGPGTESEKQNFAQYLRNTIPSQDMIKYAGALIKQDEKKKGEDISEYLTSQIFSTLAPNNGVKIATGKSVNIDPAGMATAEEDQGVYVISKFAEGYAGSLTDNIKSWVPGLSTTNRKLKSSPYTIENFLYDKNNPNEPKVGGIRNGLIINAFIRNFDPHTDNIILKKNSSGVLEAEFIDGGAAFNNLKIDEDLAKYRPMFRRGKNGIPETQPINHFNDYPKKLIYSKGFVDDVNGVVKKYEDDIAKTPSSLDKSFDDILNRFGSEALNVWARRAMPDLIGNTFDVKESGNIEKLKGYFKGRMLERAKEIKKYGIRIQLGLMIARNNSNGYYIAKSHKDDIRTLIDENPDFFKEIAKNPDKFWFADGSKNKKDELKLILDEIRKAVIEKGLLEGSDCPGFSENTSETLRLAKEAETTQNLYSTEGKMGSLAEALANFTSQDQMELANRLHGYINNNSAHFNQADHDNTHKELRSKEIDFYRLVTYDPQHNLQRTPEAVATSNPNEKTLTIAGVEFKEKEIENPPPTPVVQNGVATTTTPSSGVNIKKARIIEFPDTIGDKKGPLDLMFAVKDEQGNNIPKNIAMYFTAHYNSKGDLVSMTHPQPIKFDGDKPESIGYIEHDGKIYTLPVTKENYDKMLAQKNKAKMVLNEFEKQNLKARLTNPPRP